MIGRLHLAYLIGICILGGIIVQEVVPSAQTVAMPVAAGHQKLTRTPQNPTGATPASLVAIVLAHPLFDPSRRPAASTAPPHPGEGTPRLSGVIVSANERLAIFTDQRGKPILASEGERVGPWIIKTIEPDDVVVTGHHGIRRMQPLFAAQATQPATSPAPHPDPLALAMAQSKNRLLKLLAAGRGSPAGEVRPGALPLDPAKGGAFGIH